MKTPRPPQRVIKRECFVETPDGRLPLTLKRSTGRRTLTITISENAQASVAAPFHMADREIAAFLLKKAEWIARKVREVRRHRDILDRKQFADGHEFLFLGNKYKVSILKQDVKRSRITFDTVTGWIVCVPASCPPAQHSAVVKNKMTQWYRIQALEILGGRIFHYSRLMGVESKKITVRTQKRLWGCCDFRSQSIRLNWLIILSPLDVVDYVVVHELCHLTVPNHSKRFWKKVEKVMPDFRQRRQWLKANHADMILP